MGNCVSSGKHQTKTIDAASNAIRTIYDKYKYIDNRKFLNDENCNYLLPIDDEEITRLQSQHYLYRYAWGGNFSSPIEELFNDNNGNVTVLDVGCGPATFLLEMASDFPQVNFIGIDVCPMFPSHIKPSNLKFIQMNIFNNDGLCQLPFNDNSFDFVYQRFMDLSLKEYQWSNVLTELCRITKRGGWIELMETDLQFHNEGEISAELKGSIFSSLNSLTINPRISQQLPQLLLNTNKLTNLARQQQLIPCGSWGGTLGNLAKDNVIAFYRSIQPIIQPDMNISANEYKNKVSKMIDYEINSHKTLISFLKDWFMVVCVPLEGLIAVLYWTIITYDEKLLLTKPRLPIFIDLGFHLIPAVCLWTDFLFFTKEFRKSYTHILYIFVFGFIYIAWINFYFITFGEWPYPLLNDLEDPQRFGCYFACIGLCIAVYHLGKFYKRAFSLKGRKNMSSLNFQSLGAFVHAALNKPAIATKIHQIEKSIEKKLN
ncbi:12872_t:CDS:2 [Funneliformis geosporum]|nr:12872_t:CDS:2 [Funneliformis geosporum]